MTEPMQALHAYAQEHMVLSWLRQEPEYRDICRSAERQEEILRAMLDGDALQQLEKLLNTQLRLSFLQEGAVFQAGFRLALELMGMAYAPKAE